MLADGRRGISFFVSDGEWIDSDTPHFAELLDAALNAHVDHYVAAIDIHY